MERSLERRFAGLARGVVVLALVVAVALLVTWWLARNDLASLALRDPPVWVIVAAAGDEQRGDEGRSLTAVPDSCATARLKLQAMGEYAAGHYALALVTLEGYLEDRPEDAAAQFYAGVCALAVGSARRARAHLGSVAVQADYRERARFYIAQAFLLGGHRKEACAALRDAAAGGGKYALRAGEQLQEVEAIPAGLWRLVPWR